MKSLPDVDEILRSAENDTSPKAGRSYRQNSLGAAALRRRGVWQRCGRRQVSHFAGKAGSPTARQPRRGGVLWDIYGLKTSHFESFQSWTLRNVSHLRHGGLKKRVILSHFGVGGLKKRVILSLRGGSSPGGESW